MPPVSRWIIRLAVIGKEGFLSTGDPQAMGNVAHAVFFLERFETVIHHDTLGELRQIFALQELPKVRLSREDNLENGRLIFIEIGQQPQLFQQFDPEILRFIDDQQDPPMGGRLFVEKLLKRVEAFELVQVFFVLAKGEQNPGQQGFHPCMGIGDQPRGEMVPMLGQYLLNQSGFAHPRVPP